jgi:hypothetical protein
LAMKICPLSNGSLWRWRKAWNSSHEANNGGETQRRPFQSANCPSRSFPRLSG